ncbi:SH3 domain-containing protein [Virgibacillus ihumii]|uniref:SH3 domain-containing protein n=1 Tax=Virgibacillus ihumii TaxID=2686091 RepID=UPI001FE6347B|nr:SH3 domain-containing protein [Virgibacillus ihumii]
MSKGKSATLGVIIFSLTALILVITINANEKKKHLEAKLHSPMDNLAKEKSIVFKVDDKEKTKKTTLGNKQKSETYVTKYIAVSELNVWSGPGVDHEVIGILSLNETIKVAMENTINGWVKVNGTNIQGYVNGNYLSGEKTKVVSNAPRDSNTNNHDEENNGTQSEDSNQQKDSTQKDTNIQKERDRTNNNSNEPKPTVPNNDAQKLNTIDANNQLILVTTNGYGTSSATVQTFERNSQGAWARILSIPGHIGKNGFAVNKVEGDGKSPTGKYSIGFAFGRSGNPGTKLPFRAITSDHVWVNDSNSSLYNTWQSRQETKQQWNSAENMDIPAYTYGFVINYNTQQTPGAGSAIFFHISNSYTLGCTGVSKNNVVKILQWLDPAKNPVIIQTPESELASY